MNAPILNRTDIVIETTISYKAIHDGIEEELTRIRKTGDSDELVEEVVAALTHRIRWIISTIVTGLVKEICDDAES